MSKDIEKDEEILKWVETHKNEIASWNREKSVAKFWRSAHYELKQQQKYEPYKIQSP